MDKNCVQNFQLIIVFEFIHEINDKGLMWR